MKVDLLGVTMARVKAETHSKVLVEKLGYVVVELLFVKSAVKLVGVDDENLGDALVKKSAELEVGILSVDLVSVKANLMEVKKRALGAAVADKVVEVESLGITLRTEALFGNLEEVLFDKLRVTLVQVYSETLVE